VCWTLWSFSSDRLQAAGVTTSEGETMASEDLRRCLLASFSGCFAASSGDAGVEVDAGPVRDVSDALMQCVDDGGS
jgi:hypothetical protein